MADFGDMVVWKMVAVLDGGKMVARWWQCVMVKADPGGDGRDKVLVAATQPGMSGLRCGQDA